MIRFLDLKKQYHQLKSEIDKAIQTVIGETAFIGGRFVKSFEEDFAKYLKANHCVGVANGTDALEIAIKALELPYQSEIIVPANSFIASAEAVTNSGHKVVFCDCDYANYTLDLEDLKKRITSKTRAVMAVHLYGHPVDMGSLLEITSEYNLRVIEDCAQAHGAEYKTQKVGTFGDVATFSFYPGKNLGAYGDAGAIVTQSQELAIKCRMIANHGRMAKYDHLFEGRNSRLDGMQAAILSVKLRYIDQWNEKRRYIASLYHQGLEKCAELSLMKVEEWATPVFHIYPIRTKLRDQLKEHLKQHHIETGIHYPISLPKLKAYSDLGEIDNKMKANAYDKELLSLPMGEHLEDNQVQEVIHSVVNFFQEGVT